MWKQLPERIEHYIEQAIFAARWLLAPIYLGLAISLIVMLVKFMEELFHIATHAFSASESEIIVGVLSLVDLALTGSLLLAFAVMVGRIQAEEAWSLAHIDEDFQIAKWGQDAEAAARRQQRWLEMSAAARVVAWARDL